MMMADEFHGALTKLHLPYTQNSDEDSSTRAAKRRALPDGSSIETPRKPRGRPPGSKNKPKPPIIITRDADNAMRPHVLEIPGGHDVVESIAGFARRRNLGLCIMNGTGTVANVSLRQPATPGATVTFHGRYDILSLSAAYIPCSSTASSGFTISLAGAQGQVVGGSVVGALMAAGTVVIMAAGFASPSFHRLPVPDDERNQTPVSSGGGSDGGGGGAAVGGGGRPPTSSAGSDSCAMSIYSAGLNALNCQLPSVAPSTRTPYWS